MKPQCFRVAVVDLGSNAMRWLESECDVYGAITHTHYHRYPIRLGTDAFEHGALSPETQGAFLEAWVDLRRRYDAFQPHYFRAVATSAVRSLKDPQALLQKIQAQCGLKLELISGEEESQLVRQQLARKIGGTSKNAIFLDLGGGSFEFAMGQTGRSASLELGVIRLLSLFPALGGRCSEQQQNQARQFIQKCLREELGSLWAGAVGVSSGGPIRVLAKLLNRGSSDHHLRCADLKKATWALGNLEVPERIESYAIRADRADTLLCAALLVDEASTYLNIENLLIPGTGLRESLVTQGYQKLAEDCESGLPLSPALKATYDALSPLHQRTILGRATWDHKPSAYLSKLCKLAQQRDVPMVKHYYQSDGHHFLVHPYAQSLHPVLETEISKATHLGVAKVLVMLETS